MGANDVADAFGTSVGTGTVTVTQAFILATIVEMMGSVASGLTGTAGKSLEVVDTSSYADNPDELVIGQIAMLIGCSTWLIIATFYSMPVSSIHSLLGATMGFSFVLRGVHGIVWRRVAVVAAVWVLSPVASAIFTLIIFFIVDVTVLRAVSNRKSYSNPRRKVGQTTVIRTTVTFRSNPYSFRNRPLTLASSYSL